MRAQIKSVAEKWKKKGEGGKEMGEIYACKIGRIWQYLVVGCMDHVLYSAPNPIALS